MQKVAIFALIFGLILVAGCTGGIRKDGGAQAKTTSPAAVPYKNITEEELGRMLASKNFFLLDVHVPEIKQHLNKTDAFIPYDAIPQNLDKLPKDKNAKIVVYCRTGRMSAQAAQTLAEAGYTNVYNVQGGVKEYREEARQPKPQANSSDGNGSTLDYESLVQKVIPREGINLKVKWGDLGVKTVGSGALDVTKLDSVMKRSGKPLTSEQMEILFSSKDEYITISGNNSQFVLNLFWAFGLVNKNRILTEGPMSDNKSFIPFFASTGGWPLGDKSGGELFASRELIRLDERQQKMVEEVTVNAYRPCCDNPASFPDCNHGMAALALAEWMAYQNASREDIYSTLLAANSYWFPQAYVETAAYLKLQNRSWEEAGPKEILSATYSSARGYLSTNRKLAGLPDIKISGGGCGV